MPRYDALPPSLSPRGLCREAAARYIGVSPTTFDNLVDDRRMPGPKKVGTRCIWDIRKLDIAFDALPDGAEENPWDGI